MKYFIIFTLGLGLGLSFEEPGSYFKGFIHGYKAQCNAKDLEEEAKMLGVERVTCLQWMFP